MIMVLFFFLLCYVSYQDIAKRRIFNHSVVLVLGIGILFLIFPDGNQLSKSWSDSLIAATIFFALFFSFYALGWMGAGDVKFGAVLAFCLGLQAFFYVWVISIVVAIMYSQLVNVLSMYGMESIKIKMTLGNVVEGKKYVPYGALLSISAMIFILGAPWVQASAKNQRCVVWRPLSSPWCFQCCF